jgi:hypothetical protein
MEAITFIGRLLFYFLQLIRQECECVGFEVPTAMFLKTSIFWDITSCSLLKVKQETSVKLLTLWIASQHFVKL